MRSFKVPVNQEYSHAPHYVVPEKKDYKFPPARIVPFEVKMNGKPVEGMPRGVPLFGTEVSIAREGVKNFLESIKAKSIKKHGGKYDKVRLRNRGKIQKLTKVIFNS